jgi:succinate dehydrogenase/fumarate reductase flavoprotein subunit
MDPDKVAGRQIVVVGAGMAGLVAAVQAQELGADVVVLEKGDEPGGSMAMSGGTVWCPRTYEDVRRLVPRGDPKLALTLVSSYLDGVSWLKGIGTGLREMHAEAYRGIDRYAYELYPGPQDFTRHMVSRLNGIGGRLMTKAAASELLLDDAGAVSGVRVDTPSGAETVPATAVILATGGFQGNPELMSRYFGRWSDRLVLRANLNSTGDGFLMGSAVGAAPSRAMSSFYGHLISAPPAVVPRDSFTLYTHYYSQHAVLLDLRGERFVDESRCDETNAEAVVRQPEAMAFLVFDEEVHTKYGHRSAGPGAPEYSVFEKCRSLGGVSTVAPTLEDLAAELQAGGVYGRGVLRTIQEYNEAITEGRGPELRISRTEFPNPVATPPFYALAVTAGVTITYGGLRINSDAQVIGRSGRPVRGLYAAGADAGGIYNEGYAGGLAMGMVFGRQAARHAVSYVAA